MASLAIELMNTFFIVTFIYIPISLGLAFAMSRKRDLDFIVPVVVFFWLGLSFLTVFINDVIPFADGGDDSLYYYSTQIWSTTLGIFDFNRFAGMIEQPGFPILLGFFSVFAGIELLAYKLLNLLFLIATALTWYRIGTVLVSPAFGRVVMVAILLTTPLWYYVFFLLKEMSIVLLQSLFLLGLVESYARRSIRPWLLVAAATLPMTLFRAPLILQNASVAIAALTLVNLGRGGRRGVLPLAAAGIIFGGLVVLASNPDLMSNIGVSGASQVLGSEEMSRRTEQFRTDSTLNALVFPLIYLFTETSGLTPETWRAVLEGGVGAAGPAGLRGLLALPWIFLTAPFFVQGLRWVAGVPRDLPRPRNLIDRFRSARAVTTPWGAVLLFVLSSMVISWVVGETTRWRVADMPAFVALAVAGWYSTPRRMRLILLLCWAVLLGGLAAAYYALLQ